MSGAGWNASTINNVNDKRKRETRLFPVRERLL